MDYEVEKIAATLRATREKQGLSQRELSARSGVPQSHISKIETGGVDLRISSLASIANALGLEIALVPRKAVPAVKSITRSVDDVPRASPEARKELARIAKQVDVLKGLNLEPSAFENLQRQFREMQQVQNLLKDNDALRQIRRTLRLVKSSGGINALTKVADQMRSLRNALAQAGIPPEISGAPRAAYRLDGDDDE